MLPNESLLQVLHFADYATIVLAKLSGRRFLRLYVKFAEELACRRSFRVFFYTSNITCVDMTVRSLKRVPYKLGKQDSLVAASRELAGVIGPHAVTGLSFSENTWNMPGIAVVFEAAPPLEYVEDLGLYGCNSDASPGTEAFMSNFAGTNKLRRIKFTNCASIVNTNRSVKEFVLDSLSLPRVQGGHALELDFSENYFSGEFCLRIIQLLKDTGRPLTVRLALCDRLMLDTSDYAIQMAGTTTHYTSKQSRIAVKVRGRKVAVRTSSELPPTKRRRVASEEVLRTMHLA